MSPASVTVIYEYFGPERRRIAAELGERKRVRKNDRFVEPDVFGPSTIEGWGASEGAGVYAEAKIQELAKRKMRSGQTGTCQGQWRLLSKTESLSI